HTRLRPPRSVPFPYTTLFRSRARVKLDLIGAELAAHPNRFVRRVDEQTHLDAVLPAHRHDLLDAPPLEDDVEPALRRAGAHREGDRKSTRLNSSHVKSSYAVF